MTRPALRWLIAIGVTVALLSLLTLLWTTRSTLRQELSAHTPSLEPSAIEGQRNAFSLLWLLGHDLSEEVAEQIAEQDVERINALLLSDTQAPESALVSAAEGRYPEAPELQAGAFVCAVSGGNCLTRLRNNPEAARNALAGQQAVISQLQALAQRDHYRHRFVDHPDAPALSPAAAAQTALLTDLSLQFIDGRQQQALDGACTHIAAWRRISGAQDHMRLHLLASASIRRHMELVAEMLAEFPLRAPLPESCTEASRPLVAEERNLCAATAAHRNSQLAAYLDSDAAQPAPWYRRAISALMQVPEFTEAWSAELLAPSCDGRAQSAMDADLAYWRIEPTPSGPGRLQCLTAPLSCHYARAIANDAGGYHDRILDHQARLSLFAYLLQLRSELASGADVETLLTREGLAGNRKITRDSSGRSISIEQRAADQAVGQRWSLPLPASAL